MSTDNCLHQRTGRRLAALIASYANRREVARLAGTEEEAQEWAYAIGTVHEEMAANWSHHVKICEMEHTA